MTNTWRANFLSMHGNIYLRMIIMPPRISRTFCIFSENFPNDYLNCSSQDFFFHYEMHLHILFTSHLFPTAKPAAFWANMHMDDLGIHSTLILKLAFSCFPILFLSHEFYLPGHLFPPHVSVIFRITVVFFLFLFGTCPLHLFSSAPRVLVPKVHWLLRHIQKLTFLTPLHLISLCSRCCIEASY